MLLQTPWFEKYLKPFPYLLEWREGTLRLTIFPKQGGQWGYLCCLVLFLMIFIVQVALLLVTLYIFENTFSVSLFIAFFITLFLEVFLILYFFASYWWRRYGKEIFVLSCNQLMYIQTNKPFKSSKCKIDFKEILVCYQLVDDAYYEEEDELLDLELDLDKVKGNYSILFYMNKGENIVISERRIPIDVIRKMHDKFTS